MILEFQGNNRWLSNFMPAKIEVDGIKYPSVEHAYQAAKCDNPAWKERCADIRSKPGEIKRARRHVKLIAGWEEKKIVIMRELLIQKYTQEPYYSKLVKTGEEKIQEGNLWHDTFWGVDLRTGKGENWLGKLIMEIRNAFKE